MASSKKTREEKEKKKSKAKETKPAKPEKNKANTSSKKQPKNKKKTGIGNGIVREPEDEVIIIPASSTDSQEDSDNEQEKRRLEATNESRKSKKPKKSSKKKDQDDDADDEEEEEEDKEDAKVCNFPMSRIRRIIKSQSSDFLIAGDAVFLVNKATDKFLEQFCEDAYACCSKDRKKSLAYKHLASVVSKQRRYDFLSDFVPEKIKAEDALAERKLAEAGKDRTVETH